MFEPSIPVADALLLALLLSLIAFCAGGLLTLWMQRRDARRHDPIGDERDAPAWSRE